MKQQNKNFLLNAVYQLLTYVFPLLTVPYVSRTLGVDNVGIYSYTYSIVYMFMLVAKLGIDNYGNREIARVRDEKELLSKTFASIYGLQMLLGFTSVLIYVIYAWGLCRKYVEISKLQIVFLLSACIDVSWFYFGIEQFKMTIARNLIIKVGTLALVFFIVKNENDLWKYTLIMAGATFFSQVYLFSRLHCFIKFEKISFKEVSAHFSNVLLLFIPVLAFSIYRVMDKTMLGTFSSVTELGYYENAERLINIPIGIINALGTVMLPHMAYMTQKGKQGLTAMISESMNLAMVLATMMAGGLILIAHDAAVVIFGDEFAKSGDIIVLLAVTVIASAWANVIRTQYLIPNRRDAIYVKSTLLGAALNLICNLIFIRRYGACGACIGTICAEYFIMLYQCVATRKALPQKMFVKQFARSFCKTFVIVFILYFATAGIDSQPLRLAVKFASAVVLFILLNHKFVLNFVGLRRK